MKATKDLKIWEKSRNLLKASQKSVIDSTISSNRNEGYKEDYYQELYRSQAGWHENANDYSFFIIFHFQMLYRCYAMMNERFAGLLNDRKTTKTERIKNTIFNSLVPLSKKGIAESLPDISLTTIEKVLSDLLKEDEIKKIGTYKNARYIKH